MQLPFLNKSKPIVGVDIGSSAVKAVEIHLASKGFEVTHMGMASVPAEAIVQGSHG